ncbi:hypothetical protein [Qipengyuania atrilutea]|uniref:Uncharacterized protein n=1 Tax=Qipengyuania atrilutea TaxID=2744473 RepID=A0A850H577_9SPHN|nr:hypothetical protein [Actirhodobacter atriluteus]NVD45038.1 hypothetical protein [Actirhodobacter atriluteus]
MRLLGYIVAGCIALAVLQAAVVAGVVLCLLLWLYALIVHLANDTLMAAVEAGAAGITGWAKP